MKKKLLIAAVLTVATTSAAYALVDFNPRESEITNFYAGHSHDVNVTIDAPQHSGGTDKYGCHNASVPYHCH